MQEVTGSIPVVSTKNKRRDGIAIPSFVFAVDSPNQNHAKEQMPIRASVLWHSLRRLPTRIGLVLAQTLVLIPVVHHLGNSALFVIAVGAGDHRSPLRLFLFGFYV